MPRPRWKKTPAVAKPKTDSTLLKELEQKFAVEDPDHGLKKVTIPEGYPFSDNMDTVATIKVIVQNLASKFLNTKPEKIDDKVWEKQKEEMQKDWTKRLGTIDDMSALDELLEASAGATSVDEFFKEAKV